jgi:hypothetical protein
MNLLSCLKEINLNYANAIQALTPIMLGVISWIYYKLYKEKHLKEGDASYSVSPKFWSIGEKYKILAVHKYEKADDDVSGYKHLSQNSRPDQWNKLIVIKSSFLNLRHEVTPINSEDILDVIVSRNGTEKWRVIKFNR